MKDALIAVGEIFRLADGVTPNTIVALEEAGYDPAMAVPVLGLMLDAVARLPEPVQHLLVKTLLLEKGVLTEEDWLAAIGYELSMYMISKWPPIEKDDDE